MKLALGNVAVIALDLLFGLELSAEIRRLALPALAMLARTVFTPVEGAAGPAQMFSPIRRSILYFASVRFVIAIPLKTRYLLSEERALLSRL